MRVYREERPLERPPEAVARSLFGDVDCHRQRTTTRAFGLYRTEIRLQESAGVVRTEVAVPGVVALTALAVVLAGVGALWPTARLLALWACALAVVIPLGHLLPGLDARPERGRVVDRCIAPISIPAYVATMGLLWLTLRPTLGLFAALLCGGLLAAGLASYVVATGWRTASVSALWLAVAGLLPVLSTVANLAVASALLPGVVREVVVAASLVVATISLGLVVGYGWLTYRSVREATFTPLGSLPLRSTLFVGYLSVVIVLCAVAGHLAWALLPPLGPVVVVLLCAPLFVPVSGWLYNATETTLARWQAIRSAERRVVDDTTLYVLDSERVLVQAVPLPRSVLVSRAVVEQLSTDELVAVLAHERHHLTKTDRVLFALATLAAVPVGRNPLVAFLDFPSRERAADRYAAETAGTEPLVRALRKLEALDHAPASTLNPVAAQYALLYGAAPNAAAYPSVNERIAAVTQRQ